MILNKQPILWVLFGIHEVKDILGHKLLLTKDSNAFPEEINVLQ